MARQKTIPPKPSTQPGQRSQNIPLWLNRILPIWQHPGWQMGEVWRNVVLNQPMALLSRNTLIEMISYLEFKIEPRDSSMRNELKSEIQYYEKFLRNTGDYDFIEYLEPTLKDALDIPFGGALEIGRENDDPNGRVVWVEPIDGATLFPTLNKDWPVGQTLREQPTQTIYFPKRAINRIYMSPRTEIRRKGWGMAPPESIYLAISLLSRGDRYYANLLLDTPEVGILDLMDMSGDSAKEWISSWKELLEGVDPFKIPVLYEHEKEAKFVSFTRSPTEIMFDKAIVKYDAITVAGYGLTLSDLGIPSLGSGGDTLAGSIRGERKTRRTGLAILKNKIKAFFDRILPDTLEFKWIDLDDEFSVALGRARLASATAFSQLVEMGVLAPSEARQQIVADGLISISIPEEIPKDEIMLQQPTNPVDERPGMLGKPVAPSQGGHGEVLASLYKLSEVEDYKLRRLIRSVINPVVTNLKSFTLEDMGERELEQFNEWHNNVLLGEVDTDIPEIVTASIQSSKVNLKKAMSGENWWEVSDEANLTDLLEMFYELHKERQIKEFERKYELGEIDKIPETVENEFLIKRFGAMVKDAISEINKQSADLISKSVISGTTKYMSQKDLYAKQLDIDGILYDNRLVDEVRKSIRFMTDRIVNQFAENVAKITNELLEEK